MTLAHWPLSFAKLSCVNPPYLVKVHEEAREQQLDGGPQD